MMLLIPVYNNVLQCHYKDIVIVLPCSFYDNIVIYKFIIIYMFSDQNN